MLTLYPAASTFSLPTRRPRPEGLDLRRFDPPESAPPPSVSVIAPDNHNWLVRRDLATDTSMLEVINDHGRYRLDAIDLEVRSVRTERYISRADDFDSIRGETESIRELMRGDWHVRTMTKTVLTPAREAFRLRADLDAYEGSTRVFCRSWDVEIPRKFV